MLIHSNIVPQKLSFVDIGRSQLILANHLHLIILFRKRSLRAIGVDAIGDSF